MMSIFQKKKQITIVLFGRTGVGKSCLANKIMNKKVFSVGHSLTSQTDTVASETFTWSLDSSLEVKIIDTPGFADNRPEMTNAELLSRILGFLKNLEEGLHIAVFCISAKTRIDQHDMQELEMLGLLLGNKMFEHTCIAITQANTLVSEHREKICQNFMKELPMIFMKNKLPPFPKDKVLFADFDKLEENFLKPFTKLIRKTSSYIPELAGEIDPDDHESIEKFLAKPEMKKMMAYHEKLVAEQKKQIEAMQQTLAKQAEENELQAILYQEEIKKSNENLEMVKHHLESQNAENKSIRRQAEEYQREEEERMKVLAQKLESLTVQNNSFQQMLKRKDDDLAALNTKLVELKAAQAAQISQLSQVIQAGEGRKKRKRCNIF